MTGRTLNMGEGLALPLAVLGTKIGIHGMTGSGKTSTAAVLVEEAAAQGVLPLILDPTGALEGIASSADGQGAGVPVVVFGGERGDVPLVPHQGRTIARLVADRSVPGVLVNMGETVRSDQRRIVHDVLDELYHRNRQPVLVVLDEAQRFAPQNATGTSAGGDEYAKLVVRAIVEAATMGRRKGLGLVFVCPRPSSLAAAVRELCDLVIAHKLRGRLDRKAIMELLDEVDDDELTALLRRLPKLDRGEALVSDGLDLLDVYRIRPKNTFDTSFSPLEGGDIEPPAVRAEVDLAALRDLFADADADVEDADAAELRDRLAAASHNLAAVTAEREAALQRVAELESRSALDDATEAALRVSAANVADRHRALEQAVEDLRDELAKHSAALARAGVTLGEARRPTAAASSPPSKERTAPAAPDNGNGSVGRDQLAAGASAVVEVERVDEPLTLEAPTPGSASWRMLEALARFGPLTRDQLATIAATFGGSIRRNLAALKPLGFVVEDDAVEITAAGRALVGDVGGADTPEQIIERHKATARGRNKPGAGTWRLLDVVMRSRERGFTRSELERLANSPGGSLRRNIAPLKSRGLVVERSRRVYPSPTLYLAERVSA